MKIRNFQQPSMIEILAEFIPGIRYGAKIGLELNGDEVQIIFEGAVDSNGFEP